MVDSHTCPPLNDAGRSPRGWLGVGATAPEQQRRDQVGEPAERDRVEPEVEQDPGEPGPGQHVPRHREDREHGEGPERVEGDGAVGGLPATPGGSRRPAPRRYRPRGVPVKGEILEKARRLRSGAEGSLAEVQGEIGAERAETLSRLGRRLESAVAAIDALRTQPPGPARDEADRAARAGFRTARWELLVVKGLRGVRAELDRDWPWPPAL